MWRLRSCVRCRKDKALPGHSLYYFVRGWSLIWGTLLTTVAAVPLPSVVSTLAAIFLTSSRPHQCGERSTP